MPDWHTDSSLTLQQADILTELDDLSMDAVILHALVMGFTSARSTAMRICWPYDYVMSTLRDYKKQQRVFDYETEKGVRWSLCEDEHRLLWLRDWVRTQRRPGGLFNPQEQREDEG